jgi:hypothetical protein
MATFVDDTSVLAVGEGFMQTQPETTINCKQRRYLDKKNANKTQRIQIGTH